MAITLDSNVVIRYIPGSEYVLALIPDKSPNLRTGTIFVHRNTDEAEIVRKGQLDYLRPEELYCILYNLRVDHGYQYFTETIIMSKEKNNEC